MQSQNRCRVSLHALGCKLNQAELQELAIAFEQLGFVVVGPRDEAEAYVLNTCTVTAEADRKVRQWLRSVRRRRPDGLVVACGCSVERDPAQLEPLADLLISNHERDGCAAIVAARLALVAGSAAPDAVSCSGRTRSLVKIQEGCGTPCTYCIVPRVRGAEQSRPLESVLATVRARVADGYREIVLTGTKPGAYCDGHNDLASLIQRVLQLPGLGRLRVSSLQPHELSDGLLELWQDNRICSHFHLSLQSGCASVLQRMGRMYSPEEFSATLERIRSHVPGAAITTDVIVGFPGETEAEFAQSLAYCVEAGFARMHVFPFSRRPGTPAAEMLSQVPHATIRARAMAMAEVDRRSRAAYVSSWLGRTVGVLWEEETCPGSGIYVGNTDNYIQVFRHSDSPLQNVLEDTVLQRIDAAGVWAGS